MSISEITSLITAIGAVVGVIVAARWGREAANAKDASIHAKDTLLNNLKISQEEVLKAKEVQITNLKEAQQEVIRAKDTHIQSLDEKIDFLNKFNPDAIKKYYLTTIEGFSAIADAKENRIKELDVEAIKLNSSITDLNGKISQLDVDNELLQKRYEEANQSISRHKEQNQYLTHEIDQHVLELRALRNASNEIIEDNKLNGMKIEKLQRRLSETESINNGLEVELYEIREANKRLNWEVHKIDDLQGSIKRYERDFREATEEVSLLRNRVFEIEQENRELSDQNAVLQRQADEVRANKRDFGGAKEEVSFLRNRVSEIEKENRELSDQNAILHSQADVIRANKDIESHELTFGSKICTNCERSNNADSRYCSYCGQAFEEKAA